ncbi:hypothetical protein HMI54_015207 [Coelomomyces lativittatus]|nr:hypothetical protein HMI54_015207 [Coelomomyces lativittatus]KAJ1514869.1 hypothetical protein HMI55_004263 [Coelomomyces lativittatus]
MSASSRIRTHPDFWLRTKAMEDRDLMMYETKWSHQLQEYRNLGHHYLPIGITSDMHVTMPAEESMDITFTEFTEPDEMHGLQMTGEGEEEEEEEEAEVELREEEVEWVEDEDLDEERTNAEDVSMLFRREEFLWNSFQGSEVEPEGHLIAEEFEVEEDEEEEEVEDDDEVEEEEEVEDDDEVEEDEDDDEEEDSKEENQDFQKELHLFQEKT